MVKKRKNIDEKNIKKKKNRGLRKKIEMNINITPSQVIATPH